MNKGMKQLILLFSIVFAGSQVTAQKNVYQIRADSVRIYSGCDTAELIIENRTKDTLGFLFNKGKGRTEFRKLQLQTVGTNAIAITGQDTLQLGTIIKTAVDTLYTSGNTLYYRKTDGTVVTVPLDLSAWGDGRYDLVVSNAVSIPSGGSKTWASHYANKVIGYDAYSATDMPALSDQAFQNAGGKNYYNGLLFKRGNTGFDLAVNWDGELLGPNGAFLRTKDDTKNDWSAWRELVFKDYADNKYVKRANTAWTNLSGPGWYRIAVHGDAVQGATNGSRAYARFIITDGTPSNHQTVEFSVSVMFNEQPTIKLISNGMFHNFPFQGIRVIRGATYEGNAIEILTTRPEALSVKAVMVDNEQTAGWSLVNWQKITTSTGYTDGLPTGMTQMNYVLNSNVVEGVVDETGEYWQFVRGFGMMTNRGYRTRSSLGLVGDYTVNSSNQKIIWTIGDSFIASTNYYGLGYEYGTQVTPAAADHQIVIAENGVVAHRFNMNGGVSLKGDLKTTGSTTSTGFYQSSLRSLKKDITLFNGDALKLISGLKISEFTYKDDKEENRHVGIIADDSDWHFSTKAHDKFDSNSAIAITMKAVQELTEKLEALNKRIDELESAINKQNADKK